MDETFEPQKPQKIFYNIQMAKAIRNIKPPYKGIVVDVRLRPNYLALVVYEENIMPFGSEQRMNIMEYLLMMREVVESFGVRCELEGLRHRAAKQ